ncbi:MAG TPA: hypothetical protein PK250_15980 [Syntrophobacter fumaroxidans]|nr:hypothetical protein [Syntrophobacter fumaroxidans]
MDQFELFFKDHQYTIQFISAFGTCAAVIVALWLSRINTQPEIYISVDKKVMIPSEAQQTDMIDWSKCKDGIGVMIRNVGRVTVYISYFSFYWKLPFPFRKTVAQQNPSTDFRREGSLKLEPRTAISLMLTIDLEDFYEKIVFGLCEINKVPFFMRRFVRKFVKLHIDTDCGTHIKAKTGRDLKELLAIDEAKSKTFQN